LCLIAATNRFHEEKRVNRLLCIAIFAPLLGGCGGHYILTVPDQVTVTGQDVTTVVRLQRNDFFVLSLASKASAMRFQVPPLAERAAYTDELGYAGAAVPAPEAPGRYTMRVSHMDYEGEEVHAEAPLYVWRAQRPVLAVDMDALPGLGLQSLKAAEGASDALRRLHETHHIIYFTREEVEQHARRHETLESLGYPDGPVLLWQRQRWHVARQERWPHMPYVVVESRLVSQLDGLREMLPNLKASLCAGRLAAEAYAEAGLNVIVIGEASVGREDVRRFRNWRELAEAGLPADP